MDINPVLSERATRYSFRRMLQKEFPDEQEEESEKSFAPKPNQGTRGSVF